MYYELTFTDTKTINALINKLVVSSKIVKLLHFCDVREAGHFSFVSLRDQPSDMKMLSEKSLTSKFSTNAMSASYVEFFSDDP